MITTKPSNVQFINVSYSSQQAELIVFVANITNVNWGLAWLNLSKLAILTPILGCITKVQYKSSWDD
jgi:hypothetical protein